jgi:hypothetical protein
MQFTGSYIEADVIQGANGGELFANVANRDDRFYGTALIRTAAKTKPVD